MTNFTNPYSITHGERLKIICEKNEIEQSAPLQPARIFELVKTYVRSMLTDAGIFWLSYLLGLIAILTIVRYTFF